MVVAKVVVDYEYYDDDYRSTEMTLHKRRWRRRRRRRRRRRIAIHEERGGSQYMRQFQEEMMQRGVHCLG